MPPAAVLATAQKVDAKLYRRLRRLAVAQSDCKLVLFGIVVVGEGLVQELADTISICSRERVDYVKCGSVYLVLPRKLKIVFDRYGLDRDAAPYDLAQNPRETR